MDVTLAIAIVALVLGAFASALHARELLHAYRFRRPMLVVKRARVLLEERDGVWVLRPEEKIALEVRGAARRVSVTSVSCLVRRESDPRVTVGQGGELQVPLGLEPEVWTPIFVDMVDWAGDGQPPERIEGRIIFTNPVDTYTAAFALKLDDKGQMYHLDDGGAQLRMMRRAMWQRPWYSRLVRAAKRRVRR